MQDVTLSDLPGTVRKLVVARTAKREGGQWVDGTPKSDASTNRVVPLAPWLANDLRDYLAKVHPFSATNVQGNNYIAHAPLFPGRRSRYSFDWAKPVVADNLYDYYLQPAEQ